MIGGAGCGGRYDGAMETLEARLKGQARALGFELAGIAPAAPADGFDRLRDWLDRGFDGEMDYMRRHAEARRPLALAACLQPARRDYRMYRDRSRRVTGTQL